MSAHQLCDEYLASIKSCYRGHNESFRYFKDLADYVSGPSVGHDPSPQQPSTYLIDAKPETSPRRIPVRPVKTSQVDRSSITIIEGHISPSCICPLGVRLRVRPELFIGHLNFIQKFGNRTDFYGLPVLPSQRNGIYHVHIFSLVRSPTQHAENHPTTGLANKRKLINYACMRAEKELFEGQKYGATRIRRVHLHSQKLVSIEQVISFAISHDNSRDRGHYWHGESSTIAVAQEISLQKLAETLQGILLLDQGSGRFSESLLPWSDQTMSGRPLGLVPTIPYNAPLHQSDGIEGSDDQSDDLEMKLDLFHPLRHLDVRDEADHELLLHDPFFVFASIVRLAVTTWNMLLNAIEEDIGMCEQASLDLLESGMEQLRFNTSLISRIEGFAAESCYAINNKGSHSWPKEAEQLKQRKHDLQVALRNDTDEVKRRCTLLSTRCERATTTLLSVAQLRVSQHSTNQADQVTDISRLAFIFIPLSLLVSAFSMNIAELTHRPSIWVVLTIAVPLTLGSFGLINRNKIRTWITQKRQRIHVWSC